MTTTCSLCGTHIQAGVLCPVCAALCTACGHQHHMYEECPQCGHHRKRNEVRMTPHEAARAVAEDLDLIGTEPDRKRVMMTTWVCGNCGLDNPDGNAVCWHCNKTRGTKPL